MALLDTIKDAVAKVVPQKQDSIPKPGLGSMVHEEDMIVSKPAIVFHASETFFSFLALCCFASVAAFQAHWGVGPSGLSGFSIFIALLGMLLALFMLLVPVIYEKYDKLIRLARAMKEVRVGFILAGAGLFLTFLISFITTISAWTEPGCKNKDNDPNASKGDDFKNGLPGWCSTKKAGAIFFWLSTICWIGTMVILVLDWRSGKSNPRRDPNFNPPSEMHIQEDDEDDDDEESRYGHISSSAPQLPPMRRGTEEVASPFTDDHRYRPEAEARPRPSIDAYGAFSDPAPSGFGAASPGVSRTMQYADPYAAVRANLGASTASQPVPQPPSYDYPGEY
ncbi:hypothetical protein K439DRAFT_1629309 [Ramaria rubella]|nr:hypothetical protein K439DRAFT_1629309 [Ramaria rubella]